MDNFIIQKLHTACCFHFGVEQNRLDFGVGMSFSVGVFNTTVIDLFQGFLHIQIFHNLLLLTQPACHCSCSWQTCLLIVQFLGLVQVVHNLFYSFIFLPISCLEAS